jgi:hypothetical protein
MLVLPVAARLQFFLVQSTERNMVRTSLDLPTAHVGATLTVLTLATLLGCKPTGGTASSGQGGSTSQSASSTGASANSTAASTTTGAGPPLCQHH